MLSSECRRFFRAARLHRMETSAEFSTVANLPGFPIASVVTRHNSSDDPEIATAETVGYMRQAAIEDSRSPQVRLACIEALRGSGGSRGQVCEAVYRWIASRIRFQSDDPVLSRLLGLDNELDLLIRPTRLLTMSRPAEDCDGFTMLCCSMLLACGVPCEIVTIKADPEDPSRFSHVYCQAILENGEALVMDCSQAAQHGYPLGWEAPEYFDRKSWGAMTPEPVKRTGLHGYGLGAEDGFDWGGLLQTGIDRGFDLAKLAIMPVGYVQTPTSVANYGSGATPALSLGPGGISTSTLLFAGLGLVAILALSRGK